MGCRVISRKKKKKKYRIEFQRGNKLPGTNSEALLWPLKPLAYTGFRATGVLRGAG